MNHTRQNGTERYKARTRTEDDMKKNVEIKVSNVSFIHLISLVKKIYFWIGEPV